MPTKPKITKRVRQYYEGPTNRGWYAMPRGWLDDPFFGEEPFSKRDAWYWMVGRAIFLHEGYLTYINGHQIRLNRGQFSDSIRYMAEAFGWDDSRVNRYIKNLKKIGWIETSYETGQTIITICNYDQYQSFKNQTETGSETGARQQQNKIETNNKNDNKDKNENTTVATLHAPDQPWKQLLKKQLGDDVFRSWIERLYCDEAGFVVAPTKFMMDYVQIHFRDKILQVLKASRIDFKGFKHSGIPHAKQGSAA
jgi:DnaA N-terminal domain